MSQPGRLIARDRQEAQAIEIVFALLVGCVVLVVLVAGGLWGVHLLGVAGPGWAASYGLVAAAALALACTIGVLVRARQHGL